MKDHLRRLRRLLPVLGARHRLGQRLRHGSLGGGAHARPAHDVYLPFRGLIDRVQEEGPAAGGGVIQRPLYRTFLPLDQTQIREFLGSL